MYFQKAHSIADNGGELAAVAAVSIHPFDLCTEDN